MHARLGYRALKLLALATASSSSAIALAQSYTIPFPPVRSPTDENGVNLANGQLNLSKTDVSVGPLGPGGLAHTRYWTQDPSGGGWRHGFMLALRTGFNSVSLSLGNSSATFSGSDSAGYTSKEGDGSTLTRTGDIYTYTASDGTVYTFDRNIVANEASYYGRVNAVATSIIKPNGEQIVLTYDKQSYERTVCTPTGCETITTYVARLTSVTNNLGYQIHYNYASSDPEQQDLWYQFASVQAINNSVEYCSPSSITCINGAGALMGAVTTYNITTSGGSRFETVTDPASRVVRYTTNTQRRMTAFKRATSSTDTTTYSYDFTGKIQSVANPIASWGYSWSTSGNVLTGTLTLPLSRQRIVTANTETGNVLTDSDGLGRVTSFEYDQFGRQTKVIAPEGNAQASTYDARGNVLTRTALPKTGGGSLTTTWTFPGTCINLKTCNQPESMTDPLGYVTNYDYYAEHGGLKSVTLPGQVVDGIRPQTRYAYSLLDAYYLNGSGTIVQGPSPVYMLTAESMCQTTASCTGTADEVKTTYGYGAPNVANTLLLTSVSKGAGNGSLTATTTMTYGVVGNLRSVDGPLPGTGDTTTYTFNGARQVRQIVYPDPDGSGPLPSAATQYGYFQDGQLSGVLQGTYVNRTNPPPFTAIQSTVYTYDVIGRRLSEYATGSGVTYALTQYEYDAGNRLLCQAVRMTQSAFASAPSACVMTNPSSQGGFGPDRIANYNYDAADQVTSVVSAYATADPRTDAQFTYTLNGQVETLTDAKGNKTTMTYDGYDRASKTIYPSATTPGSSDQNDFEQLGYDADSNVTSKRLRSGTSITYVYNRMNWLRFKYLPTGNSNLTFSYGYDNLGRLTGSGNSNSVYATSVAFYYDALDRKVTETSRLNGANPINIFNQYDLAGNRTRIYYGDMSYVFYNYNIASQLTSVTSGPQQTPLLSMAYDGMGRRTAVNRANGTATSYGYDPISRLATLSITSNSPSTPVNSYSYSYSPASEIVQRSSTTDAFAWNAAVNRDAGYTTNGLNQYTAITGYSPNPAYDLRGNLTQFPGKTYSYSAENQLALINNGTRLWYDPVGRLVNISATPSTRMVYDGDDLVSEYSASGNLLRRYVAGLGDDEQLVWFEDYGGQETRWLTADERGSILSVTNNTGSPVITNSYDEFGVGGLSNDGRFQYTGQAWIKEVDQYYYKARFYAATLGRFLQPDPILYNDGLNIYDYTHADPVNATDPTGLVCDIQTGNGCTFPVIAPPNTENFQGIHSFDRLLTLGKIVGDEGTIVVTAPQSINPNCGGTLPSAPGRVANAPSTISGAVSRTRAGLRSNVLSGALRGLGGGLTGALAGAAGGYGRSVANAAMQTRPGGTWATGQAEGNIQYGAVLSTLGIPQFLQLLVGDADETAEYLRIKKPNDPDDSPWDSPVAKAQIRAGATCAR